ncbi:MULTISPECIES: hypothetical protein [unclassified Luteibacter]|uniref:hypothetical protein n=1 Tax=Luteibacter sp. PvP019 TaxID=3156436 RepID=UPI00339B0E41
MDVFGIKPETWFPVITLILGAALKGMGDFILEGQKAKREIQARLESNAETRRARAVDFQRETLLDLQEALQGMARATGRTNFEDIMNYRATKKWQSTRLSEDASAKFQEFAVKVTRLRVRVEDDETRNMTAEFSNRCTSVSRASDENDSDLKLAEAIQVFSKLNERIGDLLRYAK